MPKSAKMLIGLILLAYLFSMPLYYSKVYHWLFGDFDTTTPIGMMAFLFSYILAFGACLAPASLVAALIIQMEQKQDEKKEQQNAEEKACLANKKKASNLYINTNVSAPAETQR